MRGTVRTVTPRFRTGKTPVEATRLVQGDRLMEAPHPMRSVNANLIANLLTSGLRFDQHNATVHQYVAECVTLMLRLYSSLAFIGQGVIEPMLVVMHVTDMGFTHQTLALAGDLKQDDPELVEWLHREKPTAILQLASLAPPAVAQPDVKVLTIHAGLITPTIVSSSVSVFEMMRVGNQVQIRLSQEARTMPRDLDTERGDAETGERVIPLCPAENHEEILYTVGNSANTDEEPDGGDEDDEQEDEDTDVSD